MVRGSSILHRPVVNISGDGTCGSKCYYLSYAGIAVLIHSRVNIWVNIPCFLEEMKELHSFFYLSCLKLASFRSTETPLVLDAISFLLQSFSR